MRKSQFETDEASSTSSTVSPERLAKVDAARKAWIRQLVDMSRRNNLLYFRDLKVGTLDLSDASAEQIQRLLGSGGDGPESVRLSSLVTEARRTQAAANLTEIAKRARSNFEERGLDTLFLAVGFATWTASDGGRSASAPVLLVPIEAHQSGGRNGVWSLKRGGEVKLNDVLGHALREEHRVHLDPDTILPAGAADDESVPFDVEAAFERVRHAGSPVPGFKLEPRRVLGNFAFQKMAIVKDLNELLDALVSHDLVAAIAKDPGAEQAVRGHRVTVDADDIDRQPPDAEFLIRDADSSQQQAIVATLRGQSGVISGPPGTGKSQTISNVIAELVAQGKTVLFVAEKRAALDVVLKRLDEADLAHLCLDCHGAELSRRRIAEQFQESLQRVREAPNPDASVVHRRFVERRDRLNAHVRSLHKIRQPWGISLYALYGRLLALSDVARPECRLPKDVVSAIDNAALEAASDQMRELASLSALYLGESPSAWTGASLKTTKAVREALERVRRLARDRWPKWSRLYSTLLGKCPVNHPETLVQAGQFLDLLSEIERTLERCEPAVFGEDLSSLEAKLQPARSWLNGAVALLFDSDYRSALRSVRRHCAGSGPPMRQVLELVETAERQLSRWREISVDPRSMPARLPQLPAARSAWEEMREDLTALAKVFPGRNVSKMALTEIEPWLRALASDTVTPSQLVSLHTIVKTFKKQGLGPVLQDILARKPEAESWPDILQSVWLWSCLEEIQLEDPAVPGFNGRRHDQVAEEFRELDRERLVVAVQRVQRAHAEQVLAVRNQHAEQNTLVGREAAKRSRHLPLRRLLSEAPDVLLALRPCWMASPLSVSQLIPGDRPLFDVVIFDEASQVLPEDAVTSLLRGRQAVIAGDKHQLPPTTFFAAGHPDGEQQEEEASATQGFQSILDVMSSFLDPPWSLDWHYRSRDESLIAYSNHQIYNRRLVTFPGPGGYGAIRHVLVPHVAGPAGQETSISEEVRRVVELVQEHARERPYESLGVITMGIEHARRVEMALEQVRWDVPALEMLFSSEQAEPFFVKNLERVQGDERDAIILSIGYGKTNDGVLHHRFGPLLQDGGERRLNVAITRARQRMTVVSSFTHHDLRPDYPKTGVRLLRGYLEYAASNGRHFERGSVTDVPLNPFEQSVYDELTRQGLRLLGQIGSSRYRIDLVALHPEEEGRFVLAIECDGASYHSAPTARDRDRLRQQQLEALGWRFHRIWSTDWFERREEEVQRALQAFEKALRDGPKDRSLESPRSGHEPEPPVEAPSPLRSRRPRVTPGLTITEYTEDDLRQLVRWVRSDGLFHTDEEIVLEVARALGFQKRGRRIVAAIRDAIGSIPSG